MAAAAEQERSMSSAMSEKTVLTIRSVEDSLAHVRRHYDPSCRGHGVEGGEHLDLVGHRVAEAQQQVTDLVVGP
ncbi:hypothetical protein BH18ACT2_BH18ACT2_07680 [soil metagenome]